MAFGTGPHGYGGRSPRLGIGEKHAIALAQELGAPLLCDDASARKIALDAGLDVSGTLGVLQETHARSLAEIRVALAALDRTSFYHSEELFEKVALRAESMRENRLVPRW